MFVDLQIFTQNDKHLLLFMPNTPNGMDIQNKIV